MPMYRITRVYVLHAATKADARKVLDGTLLYDKVLVRAYGYPTELLDFESIREVAPDEQPAGFARQRLDEAKSQLLGPRPEQPARKHGQA